MLATAPPSQQRRRGSGQVPNTTFVIPPGHPNYEVTAKTVFQQDTHFSQLFLHLHVRGKDVMFKAIYPDGNEEVLLRVPKYDFNWQTSYELATPKFMPRGTTLVVVAHFDNSTGNPNNPDATAEVRWGDQTWEEMLVGYYETVD